MGWLLTRSRSGGVIANDGLLTWGFLSTLSLCADTLIAHVRHTTAASNEIEIFLIVLSSVLSMLNATGVVSSNVNGSTGDSAGFHVYHLVHTAVNYRVRSCNNYLRSCTST